MGVTNPDGREAQDLKINRLLSLTGNDSMTHPLGHVAQERLSDPVNREMDFRDFYDLVSDGCVAVVLVVDCLCDSSLLLLLLFLIVSSVTSSFPSQPAFAFSQ